MYRHSFKIKENCIDMSHQTNIQCHIETQHKHICLYKLLSSMGSTIWVSRTAIWVVRLDPIKNLVDCGLILFVSWTWTSESHPQLNSNWVKIRVSGNLSNSDQTSIWIYLKYVYRCTYNFNLISYAFLCDTNYFTMNRSFW